MFLYVLCLMLCVSLCSTDTLTKNLLRVSDEYYAHGRNNDLPPCRDCSCGERNEEPRIVGGSSTDVNAYPWTARLIYYKSFGCGASVINDRYVITAAHCVKGFMWFLFKVKFGEHDRCDTGHVPETRTVVKMYVHNFTLTELTNDISLLQLNRPLEYTHAIRPVCLPKTADNLYVGKIATVAGWGAVQETGKWSCTLLEAQLPILSNENCTKTKYDVTKIKEVMMCAGYPETAHKDACTGDSGGPLFMENSEHAYELIGIVSWGYGCARKGYPGVYTRVTKYLDWIRDNTQDACYCDYALGEKAFNETKETTTAASGNIESSINTSSSTSSTTTTPATTFDQEMLDELYQDSQNRCNCRCGERNEESRIVGGVETSVNEFPWVARLTYFNKFYCGGMLINDRYILTAAHCVKGLMWFMIKVTLGEHNRCNDSRPVTRYVVQVVAHNFTYLTFRDDVAVLRLNEPIEISDTIKPVCLPQITDNDYVGVKAIAVGWGSIGEQKNHSCTLLNVELPVLSNDVCRNTMYETSMIADGMLCAGYPDEGQRDTCQGDSGGPLTAERKDKRYELLGIVSWGIGCGRRGYPGVYTRVTKYLNWIRDNSRHGCFCSD
ncbi:transmembrane protease serine 9-like [Danaus plexippus]|uniref:transmembrane protease serine 9-like n=1 Tax=Danaus plexippus TaxID=13037 RepID=UPI002AB2C24D|nr:transmembrane protease serine 9-like [Danaus plexippus]